MKARCIVIAGSNYRPSFAGTPISPAAPGPQRGGIDPSCLIDAVEFEIIPRLLDARRGDNLWAEAAPPAPPDEVRDQIEPLTRLVLAEKLDAALDLVNSLRSRGSGLETIYIGLLAASAHRMGMMWEDDEVDFVEVTVGLCVLHQVMYRLSPDFRRETGISGTNGGRALFLPAPQETHFFGVLMAADFFARAGWRVWTEVNPKIDAVVKLIRSERFDVVGFSVSCDRYLDEVQKEIALLRHALDETPLRVILGGRAVAQNAAHAAAIGADAVVATAQEGVEVASSMLDNRVPDA